MLKFYNATAKGLCVGVLLSVLVHTASAKTYYVSPTGNDSNNGISEATPWRTINKVNATMSLFAPGDIILFKRNGVYYGSLVISKSGTKDSPITFSAYGTGDDPVLSGLLRLTGWTKVKTNVWIATCSQCVERPNILIKNGKPQAIGRHPNLTAPNGGYLRVDSHTGNTSITSSSITSTSWVNGEIVLRNANWVLDRSTIQSQSGNTLNYQATPYHAVDGNGFFIQNHLNALDKEGEWAFQNGTLYLYTMSDPKLQVIEVSALPKGIEMRGIQNIVIDRLIFNGHNKRATDVTNCSTIVIQNSVYKNAGGNSAANFYSCQNILFRDNKIYDAQNIAINSVLCHKSLIENNLVKRTALIAGMGLSGDGTYTGVVVTGLGCVFKNNVVDSIGYVGVALYDDSVTVKNNYIANFCMVKDDGAGIYTNNNGKLTQGMVISGNVVEKGIGAPAGTAYNTNDAAEGIYIDDRSNNVLVENNTVTLCNKGIYVHNSQNIHIRGNTLFNNVKQLYFKSDSNAPELIQNCRVENNIFFSVNPNDKLLEQRSTKTDMYTMATFDANHYCRPFDQNNIIYRNQSTNGINHFNLTQWKHYTGFDKSSKSDPILYDKFKATYTTGINLIANGDFANDIANWSCYSPQRNCSILRVTGQLDNGCLQFGYTAKSNNTSNYFDLRQGLIALTTGKTYVFSMDYKGTKFTKNFNVYWIQNHSPYGKVADGISSASVTPTRDKLQYYFTPLLNSSNTLLSIQKNEDDSILYVDNFKLYEAEISFPTYIDSIFFKHNPTGTAQSVSLPAGFAYFTLNNDQVYGTITIAPYSSIILYKRKNGAPALPSYRSSTEDPERKINHEAIDVYPNRAIGNATIRYTLNERSDITIIIFDEFGKEVMKTTYSEKGEGTYEYKLDTQGYKSGLYLITIHINGLRTTRKLMVN